MADNTFIVHSDWLEAIDQLPVESQDKIIADLIRYGCRLEQKYTDDPSINSYVNLLKGRIDVSIAKYEEKRNGGKVRLKVTDAEVYKMARNNMSAQEIADYFGVKLNTIQHKKGWVQRKDPNAIF